MPIEDFPKNPREILSKNVDRSWKSIEANDGNSTLFMFQSLARNQGVEFDAAKKILELGSGDGSVVEAGKKAGLNILGVDIDPRGGKGNGQVLARIEQLPFPNDTFDVVASRAIFDSFVYKQDPYRMADEILRVLKKNGIYVAMEFDLPSLPKGLVETTTKGVYRKI